MKQLVSALDRHQPTQVTPVGDRRPRRIYPPPVRANNNFARSRAQPALPQADQKTIAADISDNTEHALEAVQLERLAQALVSKDHQDLAALAASNPALIDEWQNAFRKQRAAAEQSARYWASAAAILATAKGLRAAAPCRKSSRH